MNLAGTEAAVREQFPEGGVPDMDREEQRLERFGNVAFTGLGVVLGIGVFGILYWIFQKMVISEAQVLPGVLLMAFIVFASLSLGYVIWNEILKDKRQKLEKERARSLRSPSEMPQLPPTTLPKASVSVVEHTTDLLEPSLLRKNQEDSGK